jgi:HK97 family phage portal protein
MSLFSRMGAAWSGFVGKSSTTPEGWFREFGGLGGVESATGLAISQQSAINVSTVYACVTLRAKDIARCAPRLLRMEGPRSQTPVDDHSVSKLFNRPNELQTWYEWAFQMHAAFLLKANAYAAIIRDARGNPISLWPINPDGVHLYEAADGHLFYSAMRFGLYQSWQLRSLPLMIPAEDMFHLRGLSFNSLHGVSTIGVARDAIGVALGLEQQAARFMNNGARPSGVLQTDKQLTPETAKRLREQWESLRSGIANAGKTAILEEGLKWNAMQLSSVDLEFISQRKLAIEEIARFFGMPLHKLAVAGEVGKLKLDQADQSYVNTTIMPDLDMWEQKFDQVFSLSDEGLHADFDERRLLRAEESTRFINYRTAVTSGLMTPNECRTLEGLPSLPGGDELMFPVNVAALGSDLSGAAPDAAGRPTDGTLPDPGPGSEPNPAGDGATPADATKDAIDVEFHAEIDPLLLASRTEEPIS